MRRLLILALLAACADSSGPHEPAPTVFLNNLGPYQVYLSWRDSSGTFVTDTVPAGKNACVGFPMDRDSAYWTASDGSQLYGAPYQHRGDQPSWNVAYSIQPPNVVYTFQVHEVGASC